VPRTEDLPLRFISDMTELASGFGLYPASSAAARTLRAVAGLTEFRPFNASETTVFESPSCFASDLMESTFFGTGMTGAI
jgi:hypothetical protein